MHFVIANACLGIYITQVKGDVLQFYTCRVRSATSECARSVTNFNHWPFSRKFKE